VSGPAIQFSKVGLTLSGVDILRDIDFAVAAGEIHSLIGPNGGGKTSIVRCLLGQMPHTGAIAIDWRDGMTIGYVPQSLDFDKTLPLTVDDFMAMVCEQRRPAFLTLRKSAEARTSTALERVGFSPAKRKTRLGSLSGGERQRVLFAQALEPAPDLLILDEPTTSMDEVGLQRFLGLIRELSDRGVTVLWIAHELDHVRALADTVTCIAGSVLFSGAPADVLADRPAESLFRPREAVS
jgi:zinc transport system ATP-binding protein